MGRSRKGFTLIELIFVLVIIAVAGKFILGLIGLAF